MATGAAATAVAAFRALSGGLAVGRHVRMYGGCTGKVRQGCAWVSNTMFRRDEGTVSTGAGVTPKDEASGGASTGPGASGPAAAESTAQDRVSLKEAVVRLPHVRNEHVFVPAIVGKALSFANGSGQKLRYVRRQMIMEKFRVTGEHDTGSPEVQVALMSDTIKELENRMLEHKTDNKCKRHLQMLYHKRRKIALYLYRESPQRFYKLIKELSLTPDLIQPKERKLGAKKRPDYLWR
ncbi:30S ribosomal protein S15 [Porphyridium purpureum]|uniref:30S ribosomal protein S15 n=1 Tax=Porphyridium purpureum TaxID=35688 RepID=A0A5J4YSX7_PORPP|nr:30S ribosomal protein S15 [Porphyridium purpureum]|eukprot:POR2793..scf229_5